MQQESDNVLLGVGEDGRGGVWGISGNCGVADSGEAEVGEAEGDDDFGWTFGVAQKGLL